MALAASAALGLTLLLGVQEPAPPPGNLPPHPPPVLIPPRRADNHIRWGPRSAVARPTMFRALWRTRRSRGEGGEADRSRPLTNSCRGCQRTLWDSSRAAVDAWPGVDRTGD